MEEEEEEGSKTKTNRIQRKGMMIIVLVVVSLWNLHREFLTRHLECEMDHCGEGWW